ncbi:50S ribosomal protein L3 [Gracilariopsis chorda]|uniref:Large ribosomal subunit protein uL3m n=1 Tax=Gracilariopsis chorda TaxID=448386 RepID=A0A2V3J5V6_9FLOR|nr:50S ribosomal protein L3 [Gracilariopsis chorda]|eukprot:PXF48770.1 50S ribosomal protein L3 [Gracilariopsis chorda]
MLRSLARLRQLSRSFCTSVSDTAQSIRTLPGFSGEFRPCGVLARKVGMMNLWDDEGQRHPITVLCVDRCHVISIAPPNPNDHRDRWRIQVGAGPKRPYKTKKAHRYHCAKAGVEPKQKLAEFGVHEMFKLPIGTELRASHFAPGQFVDVTGTSIGKGTQGVMKRWGFSGAPATHGTSKAHRKGGSIGMSTKPGRVFKGKKMAGRMGNEKVTVQNLMVYRIDADRNLIYVRGAVPGNSGNWVRVRDAVKKLKRNAEAPPALRHSTDGVIEWKNAGLVEAIPQDY